MATFFGEIVEQSSRAFWEDEDSDEEENPNIDVQKFVLEIVYKGDPPKIPTNIDLFIVVHGPLIEGFAKTCLLDKAVLKAEFVESYHGGMKSCSSLKKPKPSPIYQLQESVYMCICSSDLGIEQTHNFVQLAANWLKNSKQIIVLTCLKSSSYLTDSEELPISFLKELHTDNWKGERLCGSLEQPNLISGIPAGILSWCQVFSAPAIMYICFVDSYITDSISTQPLVNLFNKLPFKLMKTEKPTFRKRFYDGPESGSNLYM